MPENEIKCEAEENLNPYNIYQIQIKKYNINILIKYQLRENQEEKREEAESNLEDILKQVIKDFKEKSQAKNERKNEDIKIISLEEKLKERDNEKYILPNKYKPNKDNDLSNYFKYLVSQNTNHHINQKSGAHVFYVPSSYLPPNVLGMYVPSTHTIYVANDLSEKDKEFVYFHEEYHSIHGAGEEEADNYAFQRTGYNLRAA